MRSSWGRGLRLAGNPPGFIRWIADSLREIWSVTRKRGRRVFQAGRNVLRVDQTVNRNSLLQIITVMQAHFKCAREVRESDYRDNETG